jgi:hypothetical protein
MATNTSLEGRLAAVEAYVSIRSKLIIKLLIILELVRREFKNWSCQSDFFFPNDVCPNRLAATSANFAIAESEK